MTSGIRRDSFQVEIVPCQEAFLILIRPLRREKLGLPRIVGLTAVCLRSYRESEMNYIARSNGILFAF